MSCDHQTVSEARYTHLLGSIQTLRTELSTCKGLVLREDDLVFDGRNNESINLSFNRATAIYLVGGAVNGFFTLSYHEGFGQTDDLAIGHNSFGYTYVFEFLNKVAAIYTEALYPNGEAFFVERGEFSSLPDTAQSHASLGVDMRSSPFLDASSQ